MLIGQYYRIRTYEKPDSKSGGSDQTSRSTVMSINKKWVQNGCGEWNRTTVRFAYEASNLPLIYPATRPSFLFIFFLFYNTCHKPYTEIG